MDEPESGPRVDEGLVWQFKIVHPYEIDPREDIEKDEDKASMLMNPQTIACHHLPSRDVHGANRAVIRGNDQFRTSAIRPA